MGTQLSRRNWILSLWDATDEKLQDLIFNDFKKKYEGCYTEKDLFNFLEQRLGKISRKTRKTAIG